MMFIAEPHDVVGLVFGMFMFLFTASINVPMAIIFHRAGHNPWLSLIPIASFFILLEITGQEWWLLLVLFIPLVGPLIVWWMLCVGITNALGRDSSLAVGMMFLPFIFLPILVLTD